MGKTYSIEGDVIVINRELTELDMFVKQFLEILKRHSDYLIVSGFVSISTGRTRGTEDVDILVPVLNQEQFNDFFNDLQENCFWCYQGDKSEEVYSYIEDLVSVRFARIKEMYPNMEFIPINSTKKLKFFEFRNPQKMRIKNFEFKVPPLEFEILYKELILGAEKDIQDARHLRTMFSEILDQDKFKDFEQLIKNEGN